MYCILESLEFMYSEQKHATENTPLCIIERISSRIAFYSSNKTLSPRLRSSLTKQERIGSKFSVVQPHAERLSKPWRGLQNKADRNVPSEELLILRGREPRGKTSLLTKGFPRGDISCVEVYREHY